MSTVPCQRSNSNSSKRDFYSDPGCKPNVPLPNFDGIPEELRSVLRWCLWRFELKKGKWVKVPYQANGHRARSNDPGTWTTFDAVRAANLGGGFDGIGFMLGDAFVGVDLDDVRNPETGAFTPDAQWIGRLLATYAEISPSGTGVKLIGRGAWPADWHRRALPDGGEIEGYDRGRFFTITGKRVGRAGVADISDALAKLVAQFGGSPVVPSVPQAPQHRHAEPAADDSLIARARTESAKFARLWDGDGTGYQSRSEADLALCGLLASLTGADADRVDRLFRRSALMRDKWDDKRGDSTYGRGTVAKAIEGRTELPPLGNPAPSPAGPEETDDARPQIVVDAEEWRANGEAAAALAAKPDLYQRAGLLVQVGVAESDDPTGPVRRAHGAPVIRELPPSLLRERLSRCARFVHSAGGELKRVHPPGWVVGAVRDRGAWSGVRRLKAVVTHPVVLRDGTVLATNGYDPASGLLVCIPPDLTLNVPDRPTPADVRAAVATIDDVLRDFPFECPAHRAAWFAGLLTPLAWFGFDGPAPLLLIDANTRGAGKGLLADVIALILTGRRFPVMSYTADKEELRKKITALAIEGERLVLLDNLTGAVGNDVLDQALTSDLWKDRILGGNRVYNGPLHVAWYATGNNVQLAADTARRCSHCRLETAQERPELRTDVTYPNLRAHVLENRGAAPVGGGDDPQGLARRRAAGARTGAVGVVRGVVGGGARGGGVRRPARPG